jgi:hypothetical protein
VEYKIRLDALVRRQMIRWKLPDGLLVDVHLRLNDELPRSPTTFLRQDSTWFDSEGMVSRSACSCRGAIAGTTTDA